MNMKTYDEMVKIAAWLGNHSLYGGSGDIMYSARHMAYTMSIAYNVTEAKWLDAVASYINSNRDALHTMPKPFTWSE
jgi:hypothetical protein